MITALLKGKEFKDICLSLCSKQKSLLLLFIGGIKTAKTYGLISDIHANHISLQVALEDISQLGVDKILCVGDIVGYGGAPNEVIRLLRKYKVKCIMGNHDLFFTVEMIEQKIESGWPLVQEFHSIHHAIALG